MNTLCLYLEHVPAGAPLVRDGIRFENVAFVAVLVDGEDLLALPAFDGALPVFGELCRSLEGSGTYLLFTCACGIAEDGGWQGVDVRFDEACVSWSLEVGGGVLRYVFDAVAYRTEILALRDAVARLDVPLEPQGVVFPPAFGRGG